MGICVCAFMCPCVYVYSLAQCLTRWRGFFLLLCVSVYITCHACILCRSVPVCVSQYVFFFFGLCSDFSLPRFSSGFVLCVPRPVLTCAPLLWVLRRRLYGGWARRSVSWPELFFTNGGMDQPPRSETGSWLLPSLSPWPPMDADGVMLGGGGGLVPRWLLGWIPL